MSRTTASLLAPAPTRYGTLAPLRSLPNNRMPRLFPPAMSRNRSVPVAAFESRMVAPSTSVNATAAAPDPAGFAPKPTSSKCCASSTRSALCHFADEGLSQITSTSVSLKLRAQRTCTASTVFCNGDSGSFETNSLTLSRLTPSSQLSGCPWSIEVPCPCATTFWISTLRIDPAGGSGPCDTPSTSLRRLMLKWMGSPSPHQNQSWRRHSMVRLESTTSLTYPPSNTISAMPRLESRITVLSTVTCRMQFILPSQNFRALDADDSRQFVTVMFSHGRGGP